MKVKRWIEAKRAPRKKDGFGGSFTPSGIDIFTTDDPEIVALDRYGSKGQVRVADLLAILDELDRYEARRRLDGEKVELKVDFIKPEGERGDVYHRAGWMRARPSEDHRGLICLDIFSGMGLGSITLTADRASLREALTNCDALRQLEAEDKIRAS